MRLYGESALRTIEINGETFYEETYRTPIITHLTEIEGKRVIDLGCGRGYESYTVGRLGAKNVLGVEGREAFIAVARRGAEHFGVADRVEFANYDVRRIDEFDLGKFDVVLHFGLLYHLENPFNQLKRVRNICGGELLLETQIAPLTFEGAERAQVHQMSDLTTIYLDDVPFEGRALDYVEANESSKGSLDRRRVFWMTVASIEKALDLAGFDLLLTVHNDPPPEIEESANALGYNQQRLKAFFHAKVREPEKTISVDAGSIRGLDAAPFSFESMRGLRRLRRRLTHRLRRVLG